MILAGLAIFAGMSLNLMLQLGLGSGESGKGNALPLFQMAALFVTVLFLWIVYTYVLNFIPWEIMGYFLLFPLSALLCLGLENFQNRVFTKRKKIRLFSGMTAYNGLVPASLILTVHLALGITDALALAFFFALGCFTVVVFLREIRRRSFLEKINGNFCGLPLAFISMGLLSMIFSVAAFLCYRVLVL